MTILYNKLKVNEWVPQATSPYYGTLSSSEEPCKLYVTYRAGMGANTKKYTKD